MSTIHCPPLPVDTAQAAQSVFGREHPYLKLGEALELIVRGLTIPSSHLSDAFISNTLYPYAFVTALQYWEYLTDRQMAEATRTRLDMKYALHLPLNFPGIEASTLCEFRKHVLADVKALEVLEAIVQQLTGYAHLDKPILEARTMVAEICLPSRAEAIQECMRMAIEAVASRNPVWLKVHTLPHWYRRYHLKSGTQKPPREPAEVRILIESVGNDGRLLLKMIHDSNAASLLNLPEIQNLRGELKRQFSSEGDNLKLRTSHCFLCPDSGGEFEGIL